MKIKILDDMLAKGYIDEEEYREKLNDETFSEYDAMEFRRIAEAYAEADNENYMGNDFRRKYAKLLEDGNVTVGEALSDEKYRRFWIDLCKEIEKGLSKNITDEFLEMCKRLGICDL